MSVPRPLLIVGAGGFAREAAEAVRAIAAQDGSLELLGFLDDDPNLHGTTRGGVPILGPVESVSDHPGAYLSVCVGRPDAYAARCEIVGRLGVPVERYVTIVHPSAALGATCVVGDGSVLLANVVLTADVIVGRHVCLMPHVVLTHDVVVADYVTMASGVSVGGSARVDEGAYLGTGSSVREGCRIGAWAMVGMNSVITKDVPSGRLWYGVPARDIRRAPVPQLKAGRIASLEGGSQ